MALRGLRVRMVVVTMLLGAVVAAVMVLVLQLVLAHAHAYDAHKLARARADGVAATLVRRKGRVQVTESRVDTLDRHAWALDRRMRPLDGRIPSALSEAARRLVAAGRPGSHEVAGRLLLTRPVRMQGEWVASVVSTVDLQPYEQSERRDLWASISFGLVTVALAGVVAHTVTRRALRTVHEMAATADAWQEHDLDRRFGLGPPVDEFSELGRTLDQLLDRIASALAAERRLTDELAHELRTPVTVMRAEAQLALSAHPVDPVVVESLEAVVEATRTLEGSISTTLDVARARLAPHGHTRLPSVLAPLLARAREQRVAVHCSGDAAVGLPQEVVTAMVSPLLDNALAHARSRIEVAVTQAPERVLLHVVDDGDGVPAGAEESVFEPGWSATPGGSGLGLAVVRRVAGGVDARVSAVSDGTGHFVVDLPAG